MQLARQMALLPIDSQLSPAYLHDAGALQPGEQTQMEYNPELRRATWDRDWSQPRNRDRGGNGGGRGSDGGPGAGSAGGRRELGNRAAERGGGGRPNGNRWTRNWRQQQQPQPPV